MTNRKVSFREMVREAADLLDDADPVDSNPEYLRGMCELTARCFEKVNVETGDRADEVQAAIEKLKEGNKMPNKMQSVEKNVAGKGAI